MPSKKSKNEIKLSKVKTDSQKLTPLAKIYDYINQASTSGDIIKFIQTKLTDADVLDHEKVSLLFNAMYNIADIAPDAPDVPAEVHKLYRCGRDSCVFTTYIKSECDAHIRTNHKRPQLFGCDDVNCSFISRDETHIDVHKRYEHTEKTVYAWDTDDYSLMPTLKWLALQEYPDDVYVKFNLMIGNVFRVGAVPMVERVKENTGKSVKKVRNEKNEKNEKKEKKVKKVDKVYSCNKCLFTTSHSRRLINHRKNEHADTTINFHCTHKGCTFGTRTKTHLKIHVSCMHNIIERTCYKLDCNFKYTSNSEIIQHNKTMHPDTQPVYLCQESGCLRELYDKDLYEKHLLSDHEKGDNECEFCIEKVHNLIEYDDPITFHKYNICKYCVHSIRKTNARSDEKTVIKYLQKNENIGPYIALLNGAARHDKCATNARPDILLAMPTKLTVILEIDENQHYGYTVGCDVGRMHMLADEFMSGRVVFVRYNPDKYISDTPCKDTATRLKQLSDLIEQLSRQPADDALHIQVHYLFYDDCNPHITKSFAKYLYH